MSLDIHDWIHHARTILRRRLEVCEEEDRRCVARGLSPADKLTAHVRDDLEQFEHQLQQATTAKKLERFRQDWAVRIDGAAESGEPTGSGSKARARTQFRDRKIRYAKCQLYRLLHAHPTVVELRRANVERPYWKALDPPWVRDVHDPDRIKALWELLAWAAYALRETQLAIDWTQGRGVDEFPEPWSQEVLHPAPEHDWTGVVINALERHGTQPVTLGHVEQILADLKVLRRLSPETIRRAKSA